MNLALIDATNLHNVTIQPFNTETANTIFIDGIVAILTNKIQSHEQLKQTLTEICSNQNNPIDAIHRTLQISHLYSPAEQPLKNDIQAVQIIIS